MSVSLWFRRLAMCRCTAESGAVLTVERTDDNELYLEVRPEGDRDDENAVGLNVDIDDLFAALKHAGVEIHLFEAMVDDGEDAEGDE